MPEPRAVPKETKKKKPADPVMVARRIAMQFRELPEPERTYVAAKLREIAPELFLSGPKN